MTLSDIQTKTGKFTIAACDQRASLATMLGVDPMSESGKSTLERVKTVFMETFSPICSGVLVDPEFGMPSLEKKGRSGLLLTLEKPPYSSFNPDDIPDLYDDGLYGKVGPFAGNGTAAAKILLWYNPLSKNAELKQQLIQELYKQAQSAHTPFLLEILLHPLEKKFRSSEEAFKLQLETVHSNYTRDEKTFWHTNNAMDFTYPWHSIRAVFACTPTCDETWRKRICRRPRSMERVRRVSDGRRAVQVYPHGRAQAHGKTH